MLKKILDLNGVKKLNKVEQLHVKGGTGELDDSFTQEAEYQCCWEGTSNCSSCVVTPTPSCADGAVARQC